MADPSPIELSLDVSGVAVGWVAAEGIANASSSQRLLEEIRGAIDRATAAKDSSETAARKAAARDMLRFGAYKPTGRGKPASEYLLNAAIEDRFPVINAVVDINNLVSLESLLPVSIVDLDLAGTASFAVRRGREGESYVFNPSGQVLELRDLLLVARLPSDEPCASPIKDCQATKTHDGTRRVLGVIYAPADSAGAAEGAARRMASLLGTHCGATAAAGLLR
jgi:DNA/RNA-binding domain of Phe-tRNA-synthetase-like protein